MNGSLTLPWLNRKWKPDSARLERNPIARTTASFVKDSICGQRLSDAGQSRQDMLQLCDAHQLRGRRYLGEGDLLQQLCCRLDEGSSSIEGRSLCVSMSGAAVKGSSCPLYEYASFSGCGGRGVNHVLREFSVRLNVGLQPHSFPARLDDETAYHQSAPSYVVDLRKSAIPCSVK